jgi:hypothetical protein
MTVAVEEVTSRGVGCASCALAVLCFLFLMLLTLLAVARNKVPVSPAVVAVFVLPVMLPVASAVLPIASAGRGVELTLASEELKMPADYLA